MRTSKKIVSLVLAVMMVASMMVVGAVAVSAATYVAECDGTQYATLQEAIDAADAAHPVVILSDIDYGADQSNRTPNGVIDGKAVTIDLNGKTIQRACYGVNVLVVKNGGVLTVTDNSSGANGKIATTKDGWWAYPVGVKADSKLILEKGTITSDGNAIDLASDSEFVMNGGAVISTEDIGVSAGGQRVKVTINDGTVTGATSAVYVYNGGELTINGGTITSTSTGCNAAVAFCEYSDVEINGGVFSGNYAIQDKSTTTTSGATTLTINDGSFVGDTAVFAPSSKWYPDSYGKMEATVSGGSYSQDITSAPGTDNVTVTGAPQVVNGYTYYNDYVITTEEELVAAAAAGGNWLLGADIATTTQVVIPEGVSMTLNLGNYNIEADVADFAIVNNGTLVITGNDGCVYNTDVSAQRHGALCNYGTATINGGHFGDKDTDLTNPNPVNRGGGFQNYGTATINGGYFTACDNFTGPGTGYAYAIINYGTTTINDATVYGFNNGNIANNTGTVTVNGGNYTLTKGTTQNYYSIYNNATTASTVVNDGTFTNTTGTALTWSPTNSNVIELNGGEFTYNKFIQSGSPVVSGGEYSKDVPVQYLANTVDVEYNDVTGKYDIVDAVEPYVARIGSNRYTSLQTAVAEAPAGSTITLIDDIDFSQVTLNRNAHDRGEEIKIDLKDCTLDLNGHTISSVNATVVYTGNGATIENGSFALVHKNASGDFQNGSYGLCLDGYGVENSITLSNLDVEGGVNVWDADVVINEVSATATASNFYAIWAEGNSNVTVNSGTFSDNGNANAKGPIATDTDGTGALVTVNGGTFNATNKVVNAAAPDSVKISGGTFTKDVDVYAAPGMVGEKNADGTYGVAVDTNPLNGKIEIEGYEKKITNVLDGNDIGTQGVRIMTKVDNSFLNDESVTDYGYVVAKYTGSKTQAQLDFSNLTTGGGNGQRIVSCRNSSNTVKGDNYVTLAVNGMDSNNKVVARFYVVKGGVTYYSYYVSTARYNGILAKY